MEPNEQSNSQPANDAVWISREEYERLRAVTDANAAQRNQVAAMVENIESTKAARSRRIWQMIIGSLLAIGLLFSVSSGFFANTILMVAIIIFTGISAFDFYRSHRAPMVVNGIVQPTRTFKGNPYKWLAFTLVIVIMVPPLAMMGFLIVMLSLGGGDVGS